MTKQPFPKMRICVTGGIFLCTSVSCAKESSSFSESIKIKKKSLKYEKSERLTFEISIWVKKRKKNYKKVRGPSRGGDFFFKLQPKDT